MRRAAPFLLVALLPACATIVNGSSQTVTVTTTPPAATCTVDRMGARLGAIAQTPGSVRLDKSKNDLTVACSKPGYQTATVTHSPSFGGATFGNIIAGGVIGVVVDAASGANYEYPADIRMNLAADGLVGPPIALQAPMASQAPVALQAPVAGVQAGTAAVPVGQPLGPVRVSGAAQSASY